ncbi:MAG: HigA family addiction module antidote protein [Muribaculaceae bacterium]|nr:HigA family addiction module antidote protein [Muribaculaceae bacterium]
MGKYRCSRPIHPGELLKEEVEFRGLKQKTLAHQMELSYKILNDILNCRRPVTPSTAMLFEAALGISAEMLMRMQLDYSMRQTAEEPLFAARLKKIRQCVAAL